MSRACKTPPRRERQVLSQLEYFLPAKGQSTAIVGMSQNGKSHFGKGWARWAVSAGLRTVAWDRCWEWNKDCPQRDGTPPGPLEKSVPVSEFLERADDLLLGQTVNLAVRPNNIWAPRRVIADEFLQFAQTLVEKHQGQRLALFIDECHTLTRFEDAASLLEDMAELWGKEGIAPFFLTQRWGHLTPDIRAQIAWVVSFLQTKTSDLNFQAMDASPTFAAEVEELAPYEYRAMNLRSKKAPAE